MIMHAVANRFTFIDASTNSSQRSKEVSLSRARAHAARAVHKRRHGGTHPINIANSQGGQQIRKPATDFQVQCSPLLSPTLSIASPMLSGAAVAINLPDNVKTYFAAIVPYVRASCESFTCRQLWSPALLSYLTDDKVFHAVSAVMQSIVDAFTQPSSHPATGPTDTVLQHRALAIRQLRINLNETQVAQASALMAILLMAILESRCGNIAQRELHRTALGKLLFQRGGLGTVEDYVQSSILQFEFFWAIETGGTVIDAFGPAASESTRKLAATSMLQHFPEDLPLGFRALSRSRLLSPGAIQEIVRTHRFQKHKDAGFQSFSQELLPSADDSSTHRNYWKICPDLLASDGGESTINALICLALLLYNSLAFAELSIWDTRFLWTNRIRSVRNDLVKRLFHCRRRRSLPEELALYWVFSVTAGACRMPGQSKLSCEGCRLASFASYRFSQRGQVSVNPKILLDFLFHEGICFDITTAEPSLPP